MGTNEGTIEAGIGRRVIKESFHINFFMAHSCAIRRELNFPHLRNVMA
jgi:hypothetical protein